MFSGSCATVGHPGTWFQASRSVFKPRRALHSGGLVNVSQPALIRQEANISKKVGDRCFMESATSHGVNAPTTADCKLPGVEQLSPQFLKT